MGTATLEQPTDQQNLLTGAPALPELPNPKDLLKDQPELQNEAKSLSKYVIGLDKWVRRQEVIEARRQRFYWRNNQYIYWKSDAVGFVPATGGQAVNSGEQAVDMPRYTDVYNIYTPFGESLLATLLQNPPGVNWQPADPSKAEDVTSSQTAEKYQQKIERDNDRKTLQGEVGRLFYTDGRTILYTRDVPTKDEGVTLQLITAHGVLESKVVPITAKKRADLVALILSDELDVYKAKGTYPDYSSHIMEGASSLGESSYERIARLGVLQGTKLLMQAGDAFAHMVTRHEIFVRPEMLEKIDEKYRDEFKGMFPNGAKFTFCGDAYCGAESVSMDDEISIGFPSPGDGMSRPSLGQRMVPLQDVFNDELNLWHEAHDYCVPTLFMYSETADIDAIREQIAEPGNIIPFTSLPPGANSAESAFYAAVLEGIPSTLPDLIHFIQGPLAQFISGAFPALFGGDTGDNDTAKGIGIQRDQAMGRMGLPWSSLQELFAESYRQAVIKAVDSNVDENSTFSYSVKDRAGNTSTESIPIADLKAGSFKCVPDTDAAFPESTNAKRQTFQTMMAAAERNPILADIMSQPDNQEFGHEVMGLPELVVPGAEARNKQLIEISQLLKESPIEPSDDELIVAGTQDPNLGNALMQWREQAMAAAAAGQPPPEKPIPMELMKPSVPVDPRWDFHQFEYQTIKDWLSSSERRKEELKGNVMGVNNVRIHGLQHEKFMLEQMMQQADMQPDKNVGTKAAGSILHNKQPGNPAQPAQQAQSA